MSKLSRRFWLVLGLSTTMYPASTPALAQEAAGNASAEQPPASAEPTQSAPPQPERELTEAEQRQAGDKGGVFRPSENISEDFPMAFPVDI